MMMKKLLISLFMMLNFINSTTSYVMIALKQKNMPLVYEALQNVSNPESEYYGQYWDQAEIDQLVSPPRDEVNKLLNFLNYGNNDCEVMSSALKCFSAPNIVELSPYSDLIEFIEEPKKVFQNHCKAGDGDGYVGREVVNNLYNITNSSLGGKPSVCSVEYQAASDFNQDDMNMQQSLNYQPSNIVKPDHIINVQSTYPFIEGQLDMQMMSQTAQNSDIWYWVENLWLYSFSVNFQKAKSTPDVLSMSWGWSETDQCSITTCINTTSSQYVKRVNEEYAKMSLTGKTIVVASGDAGAPGRTSEMCSSGVNPVFPGSSPFVTSASATFVSGSSDQEWKTPLCKQYGCATGTDEQPTNFNNVGWTTGGGFSVYNITTPKWQEDFVNKYLQSGVPFPDNFNRNGRGYPDVSALGHNCPVVNSGSLMAVDGTSCSSPLFASVLTILNEHQVSKNKPKLGFANPVLYQMVRDNKDIFKDITTGNNACTEYMCCSTNNSGFQATHGWDAVTGLGTPNVGLMKEWLDKHT